MCNGDRLTVAVGAEQMRVTYTNGIVNVQITLNSTANNLQQRQTYNNIKPITSHD